MTAGLGVQMFTLRRYTQSTDDLRTTLMRLREIGFSGIQVAGIGDVDAETIAHLCQQADLRIVGSHQSWDRLRHDLPRIIDEHLQWHCANTAITRLPTRAYLSKDGLARFLAELMPVCEALSETGISLGYHHQRLEFQSIDGSIWLTQLMEQTTREQLKVELDTHWLAASGADPAQWVDKLGARQCLLHLRDLGINAQSQHISTPTGQGNLNWPRVLETASRQPIDYYLVGQDNCHGIDEFDCLQQSHDFLCQHLSQQ